MKTASALLALAALVSAFTFTACTRRLEDTVSREQLDPLRLVPSDSPVLVRVSSGGYKALRPLLQPLLEESGANPERDKILGRRADRNDPRKVIAALDGFFGSDLAAKGMDEARPIFLALLSADTAQLERVVSVGGIVEPADAPKGFRSSMLFPAKDGPRLAQSLEAEWNTHARGIEGALHRISVQGEWVRVDIFTGRDELKPEELVTAFDAEQARSQQPLRITPAVASFLTDAADLAIYLQFDRVRGAGTASGAMNMISVLGMVNEDDRATILAVGSSELAAGWMLTDPQSAELEDVAIRVRTQSGQSLSVDSLVTLTQLGRKIVAGQPAPAAGPKFADVPYFVDLRMGGLSVGNRTDVPAPRVAALLEAVGKDPYQAGGPMEALSRLSEEGGSWTFMSFIRSSTSWMAFLERASNQGMKMPLSGEALHARILPIEKGTEEDQNRLPRGAVVMQLADAAGADQFMLDARKLTRAFGPLVSIEKLPSQEGGKSFVFVGFNASPALMMAQGDAAKEPWITTLTATIQKEAFALLPADRIPGAWSQLLSAGPLELSYSFEGTVGRSQLRLGAPRPGPSEPHAPIPEFDARTYGGPTDACRFEAAMIHYRGIQVLSNINPADRATVMAGMTKDVDAISPCAKDDPVLSADLALARTRLEGLKSMALREPAADYGDDGDDVEPLPPAEDVERIKVPLQAWWPMKGAPDAKVTVVMIEDYECPFCSRAHKTMNELARRFGDDVRFAFVHNPLPFHKEAEPAARAAIAARLQGKFWEMTDLLFENQRALSDEELVGYARQLGLDVARFNRERALDTATSQIEGDKAFAASVGATGTPAFFINGRRMVGAQPLEKFSTVIREELGAANALIANGVPKGAVYGALMESANAYVPPKPKEPAKPGYVKAELKPDMPQKGRADAKLTLVLVQDFQCPFCVRLQDTVAKLEEKYGKELRVVFVNQPLSFHQNALPAAKAALAAHKQGKFWEMSAQLFENANQLEEEQLVQLAQELKLDLARFKKDRESPAIAKQISRDVELANSWGASGTPTAFLNGRKVVGAVSFETFTEIAKEELAAADAALKAGTPKAKLYAKLLERAKDSPPPGERAGKGGDDDDDDEGAPSKRVQVPVFPDQPSIGPKNAKVTVVMVQDLECPFCARFANRTFPELKKKYGDRVRFVFAHNPLEFHQNAKAAARWAMAAHKQGKFWEMAGLMFESQNKLDDESLREHAKKLKLNLAKLETDAQSAAITALVERDREKYVALGASGTPTFFINGLKLVGAQPVETFSRMIDEELAAPGGKKR